MGSCDLICLAVLRPAAEYHGWAPSLQSNAVCLLGPLLAEHTAALYLLMQTALQWRGQRGYWCWADS